MMKLYVREECPYSARVRSYMSEHNISVQMIYVPRLGSERHEVLALPGVTSAAVPVLVDGDTVIQDSARIVEYLTERFGGGFGDPAYGLTRRFPAMLLDDAIEATKVGLATQGFGVLTTIDVKATLKQKIDEDVRPYTILGACNPPLAHQAMTAEPAIGLLLPCNVVVSEDPNGEIVVSAIDPMAMFKVIGRPDVEDLAKAVKMRLRSALAAIVMPAQAESAA